MRSCVLLTTLLAVSVLAGCRARSIVPPNEQTNTPEVAQNDSNTTVPYALLEQMVAAYQGANSYSDQATIQIIGKLSQTDIMPTPRNCIVAFQAPNRLRLDINKGLFVSDGMDCYAQILSLPHQVLHFSPPEQWTLETLFQDIHLDAAMELGLPASVFRFPPQLILLFANNPLNTFCPRGAKVEWIEQQPIGQTMCDVVQISHLDGSRIFWISQENHALLRMDYQPVGLPVPEGFDSIEAIRIEMTDAQFGWSLPPETFQISQPYNAVLVPEFQPDASDLPTTEEHRHRLKLMTDNDVYRFVDTHIESAISAQAPPKSAPKTFTLSPLWTQPLVGVAAMAVLPDTPPKLLIPYEGNVIAVLDLQGNILQRISPEGLENAIIMNVQSNSHAEERRIGIITLDGKFHLFDESFKPITFNTPEITRDFMFFPDNSNELLLLAVTKDGAGIIRAVDIRRGETRWEYSFEGIPNQLSSAVLDGRNCILVSRTAAQDSILNLFLDGTALEPVEMPFGRYIIWFRILGSTIYTVWENTDTGDIRFLGLDRRGKSLWSRLLPTGEYEVDPVYVPGKEKWFVPLPSGEIYVFDMIGNMLDTFSLNVVPTGLFCIEVDNETLLIVADGETVSAWKMSAQNKQSRNF